MMAEEWKIHSLESQVFEGHRHPDRQQEMVNSEGLETEKINSHHVRIFRSTSFSF